MDVVGAILSLGSIGWVCLLGVSLIPGGKHLMCDDAIWMNWMKAVGLGAEFSTDTLGGSHMLQVDAMVNTDKPMATDSNDDSVWVQDGLHLLMLSLKMDMFAYLPNVLFVGGPYVMWDKTPLAHVIVPITVKES